MQALKKGLHMLLVYISPKKAPRGNGHGGTEERFQVYICVWVVGCKEREGMCPLCAPSCKDDGDTRLGALRKTAGGRQYYPGVSAAVHPWPSQMDILFDVFA